MLRSRFALILTLPVILLGLAACGDDGSPAGTGGSFDLTFTGDASFQGAHGNQMIYVTVEESDGSAVASETGTVSADEDPAFSFTFTDVLVEGEEYVLEYWIDSNFGGGTQGACDAPEIDHQWRLEIGPVTGDVTRADTHRPTETEPVCSASSTYP